MKNCYEVKYEKAGVHLIQSRYVFADSLGDAQKIACVLCDDHKRRVHDVYLVSHT